MLRLMEYLIIFVLLFCLEMIYFRIARKYQIVDKPDTRSSHTSVALSGGGIIFLLMVWIYAAFFGVAWPWFLLGVTLVGLVSFIDDIHPLSDALRLAVQFASVFLMFCQFGILSWHDWWAVALALTVSVGILNAYNFMDGINGITGGYSLAVLAPLIYLNHTLGFMPQSFLYVVGLGVLVFCYFNFRKKARCFAGDVGSITMAFIIVFALGNLIIRTGDFAYVVFLAVYGADTVLTICHRIMLRENLLEAHRKHAYELMANELHMPQLTVALIYISLQLAISFGMIFLPVNHYFYLGGVTVLLAVAYILFIRRNYHLHKEYLHSHNR